MRTWSSCVRELNINGHISCSCVLECASVLINCCVDVEGRGLEKKAGGD